MDINGGLGHFYNAFEYRIDENNGNVLLQIRNWPCGPEIGRVDVHLRGKDSLTGKELQGITARFSSLQKSNCITVNQLRGQRLYGDYYLEFEASSAEGKSLGVYGKCLSLKITHNRNARPYIKYSAVADGSWTRLNIESNCWKLCRGHVWIEAAGRRYLLRADGNVNLFFPVRPGEIAMLTEGDGIPKPERIRE